MLEPRDAANQAAVAAALAAICATDEDVPDSAPSSDKTGDGEEVRSFCAPRDWLQFCERVATGTATPSCVIDFPYADAGGLNLQGDARLLERMYCFHDPLDMDPSHRLVVVHVHTLLPWGDRMEWAAASRLQVATSVNARHATRPSAGGAWVQEQRKFYVVPKNKNLSAWQTLYTSTRRGEIVWRPHTAGSVPPGDPGVDWMYEKIRKVIHAGDSLCDATKVTFNKHQSETAMRGGEGGEEIEYEIVGVAAGIEPSTMANYATAFTVCVNKAITVGLSDQERDALQREIADWYPGPLMLQPGRDITLMPKSLDGKYLKGRAGKVVEHLSEDPRIVTVHLDETADESAEDIKALYSILKFEEEQTDTILHTIDTLLSVSPAAGAAIVPTLIGYNDFFCGGKAQREYWLSPGATLRLPIRAGELPVHMNPHSRLDVCVIHVQYGALERSLSSVERVSIRVTPSIELRAHQDKCRTCTLCAKRKDCAKCKDSYTAHARCTAHDDCHHCPEFKWRDVYGRQFRNEQCHILTSILSDANSCTLESRLSLDDAHQRRFAFIVGNTQYLGEANGSIFRPLGDVVGNDTIDICHQLQRFGFQVHNDEPLLNQNKSDLEHEVAKWTRSLPENAEALVFLSGHGMKLQGNHYFVSVNYTSHTDANVVETAQQQCVTLEWIQDRVLGLALRHEGLVMSFWDCCRENALEQIKVVRSSGSDPLIRNTDKLIWKLKQKTSRSAGQLTVFASASGALAHQEKTGGILAKALLAWWKHDYYAALQVGHPEVRSFVLENIQRQHTSQEQQEPQWVYDGGNVSFTFKQGVSSNAGETSQMHQAPDASPQVDSTTLVEQQLIETPMDFCKISHNKRPRPQGKGSTTSLDETINDDKVAFVGGEGGEQINYEIAGILAGIGVVIAAAGAEGEQAEIQAKAGALEIGATVRVHSLQSAPEHNGVVGEIVKHDLAKGRWGVKTMAGRVLSFKPSNLTAVSTVDHIKVVGTSDPATAVDWKAEPAWHDLPPPPPPPARFCILFVGANNNAEAKLSLEREVETMRDAFTAEWGADAWRHVVEFKHFLFADMQHLVKGLLDFKPVVVHFACHGHQSALSLYQDPVSVQRLTDTLAAWSRETGGGALRLVVANACHSAALATALSAHVDFVIGHEKPVGDAAAVQFAQVLYKALGGGHFLRSSFQLATVVKGCEKYCLRGRKDATKFAFGKPEVWTMRVFNVTAPTGGYQGRMCLEQRLHDWMQATGSSPAFVLFGLGGSGKSTLARQFADSRKNHNVALRLVFVLSAATMDQDYVALLGVLEAERSSGTRASLSQEAVRQEVHKLLSSPDMRGSWLAVLDDLPPPAQCTMEEAGLDWLLEAFPWPLGRTIITTRAAEWKEIPALCSNKGARRVGAGEGEGESREAAASSTEVGSFAEEEACSWVRARVPLWAGTGEEEGVRGLVQYLHCFPLAVAQAAEYARVYHTETPGLLQQELAQAGLTLRKGRRQTRKDEYPASFPEVVKLSLDAILKSSDADAKHASQALWKLALLDTVAIPLDLLTAQEKRAMNLLQEHSLVTVDDKGNAAMHALTQLVVREYLTPKAQRIAILTAVAAALQVKLVKYDEKKTTTYFIGRRYARHASAVAANARAWGLVSEGGGKGRRAPAAAGEADRLLDDIAAMCVRAGNFFREVVAQYRDALYMYQMALDCGVANYGHKHPIVAVCYNNIGVVYKVQDRHKEALEQYQKALKIQTRVFGDNHEDVAMGYGNIGNVYEKQGKYVEALVQKQKSSEILVALFGHQDPRVADSYGNIGSVYLAQGDFENALRQYQKCLDIQRLLFDCKHPDIAMSYSRIGKVYEKQGKYEEALHEYQKTLEIQTQVFGQVHPKVATSYFNIGSVYDEQGKYEESLEQYQKSLEISTRVFGYEHTNVAELYLMIGIVYAKQFKYKEALEQYRQCMKIQIQLLGHVHPEVATTYNNIGAVYKEQHKYTEALEQYHKSLEITTQVSGCENLDAAVVYNNIGSIYASQGDNTNAQIQFEKSLKIKIKFYGDVHPGVAASMYNLATIHGAQGRRQEARQLFLKCKDIYAEGFGADHAKTLDAAKRAESCR